MRHRTPASSRYTREQFREEYAHLVWSNPQVEDEVIMRQVLKGQDQD